MHWVGLLRNQNWPVLTNFFRNIRDRVAGQVENDKALKARDEAWDLLKSCSVKLPFLNLRELDQSCRKSLQIHICETLWWAKGKTIEFRVSSGTFHSSFSMRRMTLPSSVIIFSFNLAKVIRSSHAPVNLSNTVKKKSLEHNYFLCCIDWPNPLVGFYLKNTFIQFLSTNLSPCKKDCSSLGLSCNHHANFTNY